MCYIRYIVLLIFLYNSCCEWKPNFDIKHIAELVKDPYQGCGFDGNDNLFEFASLVYEYDVESRNERVWIDIGANEGKFTKSVSNIVPNANIYSFEPFEPVYKSLKNNLRDHKNVNLFKLAISNISEINKPFYTQIGKENDNSFSRSSLEKIYSDYYIYEYVNTTTLIDFNNKNNIKEIFFIKIDTEGYDGIILKNSMKLFKEQKVKYLYFEFNNDWKTIDPNLKWQNIVREISDSGYNVYIESGNMIYMDDYMIETMEIEGKDGYGFCFNFLAIRRGLKFERNIINRLCPKCSY